MNCEMCGKSGNGKSGKSGRGGQFLKVLIEGVEMNVCKECAPFGKILTPVKIAAKKTNITQQISLHQKEPEIIEGIVEDYAVRIKQTREKRGVNQEEFAKMLNERETIMQKIEAGKQKPTLELAKKLEKYLNIKLIEQIKEASLEQKRDLKTPLTIGDLLQRK